MSKAPQHIEKILLGAGILVGGGLAFAGYSTLTAVDENLSAAPPQLGASDTSVDHAAEVSRTLNSLASDRVVREATVPSQRLESGERPVDLFVGVPLFASRDNPNEPVDLLISEDIHPPIPNPWWLKHGVSPNFADSPERDDDGDGFSNLEEYRAGTDPGDSEDVPPLIAKLSYVEDESLAWLVEFGFQAGGKLLPKGEAQTELGGERERFRQGFEDGIEPGETFFAEGPLAGRFKFLEIEERQVKNERLNIDETLQFLKFEDLKENKRGEQYEVPNRFPKAQIDEYLHYDRTAVLELRAVGFEGDEFRVEERTRFSLPPDGDDDRYLLKEVTPEQITVEFEDEGETRSVTIPKGGLPDFDLTR